MKIEAVVKMNGHSLNGIKLILNPVKNDIIDKVLSIPKDTQ